MEEKLLVVEYLNTINKFNEEFAKANNHLNYISFNLAYCLPRDTIHSFDSEGRCYNCSGFKESKILLSSFNTEEFKQHFVKGFHYKLIEILDNWKDINHFPFLYNPVANSLPEHKKLEEIIYKWNKLGEEEKFNQIFDLVSIQNDYKESLNKVYEIKQKLD